MQDCQEGEKKKLKTRKSKNLIIKYRENKPARLKQGKSGQKRNEENMKFQCHLWEIYIYIELEETLMQKTELF